MDRASATIRLNGEPLEGAGGALDRLLVRCGVPVDRPGIAVALNGEVVRRGDWHRIEVRAGDEIEVVGAVQGG